MPRARRPPPESDGPRCLLAVDVQRGFVNAATRHVPGRVEALQAEYDLVVATRFVNPPGSPFRTLLGWHRFAPGSADTALAYPPRADTVVVEKSVYTCVTDAFLALLAERRVAAVHVCGIDTDICVTKCAVDLFERGVRPVVLSEACGSHAGAAAHRHALSTLARYIGRAQVR